MSTIQINVTTDLLKKVLDEQPAIKLSLASLAAEKIAEEVIRKVKNTSLEEIQDKVNTQVSRAIAANMDIYKDRWKFPEEAKKEVRRLTEAYILAHGQDLYNDIRKKTDEHMAMRVNAATEEIKARLTPIIRTIAREEFLTVLAEVKNQVYNK